MRHNSSVSFHLKLYMLWTTQTCQSVSFRLATTFMKMNQSPYVIFQTTSQFFFKYCIARQCHDIILVSNFLAQTLYTLVKRSPLNTNFETFECWVETRQIRHANFQSASFLLKFFSVMTYNSFVLFWLEYNILPTKLAHQSANFQTCHCSH